MDPTAREDNHTIFGRRRGTSGRWAPVNKLGAGVQSSLQPVFDDSGRQEVLWMSQRVSEGDGGNATISYTSAARGRGLTRPVVVGRDATDRHGPLRRRAGRAAGRVRDRQLGARAHRLDGAHFRTAVANVARGRVQPPLMVSPEGEDDVLAALGYAARRWPARHVPRAARDPGAVAIRHRDLDPAPRARGLHHHRHPRRTRGGDHAGAPGLAAERARRAALE
jgi:hypothetical protein